MFRKKGYRIILIVIFLIILTCVSLNIKTYNSRKRTTTQIQNIVKSCVIGDIEKSYIKVEIGTDKKSSNVPERKRNINTYHQ